MKTKSLAYLILKTLEKHYLCAAEICQKLKSDQIDFDSGNFFPTLSQLQLSNLLCYSWNKDYKGHPVKYYHLTKNGLYYIQSINFKMN